MKMVTVAATRPQFVRVHSVVRCRGNCEGSTTTSPFISGQHYDHQMDSIFFEELGIPKPNWHLGAGSGAHSSQTGQVLVEIEKVLVLEKPDLVLVYGDTN